MDCFFFLSVYVGLFLDIIIYTRSGYFLLKEEKKWLKLIIFMLAHVLRLEVIP